MSFSDSEQTPIESPGPMVDPEMSFEESELPSENTRVKGVKIRYDQYYNEIVVFKVTLVLAKDCLA